MPAPPVQAAEGDEITGTIWQDYDSDGTLDTFEDSGLLEGVEVYAYDAAGNVAGPVITGPDGTYTLPVTSDAGPWRVEANVPDTPEWEEWRDTVVGRAGGTSNGTTVQFVDTVPAAEVDFSFQVPSTFVENNPYVYLPAYRYGASDGAQADRFGGAAHEYDAMSPDTVTAVPTTMQVPFGQIGATYGTAWQRAAEPGAVGSVFASAYVRRHSGLGPGGIDAVYRITPDTGELTSQSASADVFVNLADYGIDVGSDSDPGALPGDPNGLRPTVTLENPAYEWLRDAQAWDKVGRAGLGAMEISNDQESLFAVNLYNRSLIEIEISRDGTQVVDVREHELDDYFPDDSDLRPHGISANPLTNEMYLTVTNTAESTGNRADLHAHVYAFDPADPTDLREVLDFPLGYTRGMHGDASTDYQPWSTDPADWMQFSHTYNATTDVMDTSVPIVADARYLHGDLVIGMRDLGGDLFGSFTHRAPGDDGLVIGRSVGGDLMKAGANDDGTWTIEQNGVVNGVQGAGTGNASQLNGPYGVDKFFVDLWVNGSEHLGATLVVPSRVDGILETGLHTAESGFQVGTRRFEHGTGAVVEPRGAAIVTGTLEVGATTKGNGLGELTALASAAPIEIGNYVWYDPDNDGVQDPDETPVEGATVNLYEVSDDGTRTQVNGTLTDAKGEYYFSSLDESYQLKTNTDYVVGVDNPDDYAEGGPLDRWRVTVPDAGDPNSVDPDRNDSDGIADEETGFPYAAITTGGPGENDHTIDFGYYNLAYEFDKRTVDGPTPSPDDDGTWTLTYELVAENTGVSSGSYLLTDDLTGYGDGIEVVDTQVVSGPPEADELLNPDWDGVDDQKVVTDSVDIAAESTVENGTEHVYTMQVTVRLTTDAGTGEVDVDPNELVCPTGDPGPDGTTGLYNTATLDPEGHEDLVDHECSELPLVTHSKSLISAREIEDGKWEVVYGIEVTNRGVAPAVYDLDDELHFADAIDVDSAEVTSAPDGVTLYDPAWDGEEQLRIVEGATIAGTDDDGYAAHEYVVTVVADVPADLGDPVGGVDPATCGDGTGVDDTDRALNNTSTLTDESGVSEQDDACAEVPEDDPPTPPDDDLPDTGVGAQPWLAAAVLAVLCGLGLVVADRRRLRRVS